MHSLVILSINQHTEFYLPSFTYSTYIIGAKFKKTGHMTLTTPTKNDLSSLV